MAACLMIGLLAGAHVLAHHPGDVVVRDGKLLAPARSTSC
jgi:hypothetical protein